MEVVFNTELLRGNGEHLQDEEASSPLSDWVISIKGKLDKACQDDGASSWDNLSIYKVPQYLRNSTGDDKAYVPQIVSLGPYHHGKEHLRQMERHKWRSLNHVLRRTGHDIRLYLNSMKEIEDKVRSFYEGPITLNSNEFVEMLVLDGCFVLEVFRGYSLGFVELGYLSNDPVFAWRASIFSISKDLIMLENQLPLFVLDRILGLQLDNPDQKGRVAGLALELFDWLKPETGTMSNDHPTETQTILSNDDLDGLHCLDVFRRSLLHTGPRPQPTPKEPQTMSNDPPSETQTMSNDDLGGFHCLDVFKRSLLRPGPQPTPSEGIQRWSNRQQTIPCVTELKEAGIKFKKGKTYRFLDIKFERGTLQIPRLLVHEGTKTLFLNLIAFEQCHLDCGSDITNYAFFMDYLINSPEDVGYLIDRGIIEHWLGNDLEVANLFNGLCQEVSYDIEDNYLSTILGAVNLYYERRWNKWYANLRQNYFSNPWTIISLIAAVVLLLLTLAQTCYTIYAYYRPPK
ncbi:UPF0481 protein At3g47200-like [Lotus japonicus]|uniref:UPF0481 protein At3g47200-like n=1 Tax=Lotus japonicus TaxID=34305 RepID=UPI00258F32FA|nr:UPF0481 protein At3g47200-like [Lotus japonicus]XP_057449554.1 UPF0481 protein At3g47200-like [Lotus japonicus]XP_057449555.1 UPF0481 protein At3g47200-like [Lotus japonicus]